MRPASPFFLVLLALCLGSLFLPGTVAELWGAAESIQDPVRSTATVEQPSGRVVYWVLPGTRELSPGVFGTPDNPTFTLEEKLTQVKNPVVKDLLKQVPELVSAPLEYRQTNDDGSQFTLYSKPTLFSDRAIPLSSDKNLSGSFRARFLDRVTEDQDGPPGKTPDQATLTAEFHDPQGNRYTVELDHVVQPPFPGYRTRGGVMIDNFHHGTTGTGSPLMPKVYTRAALWGVANVTVNGEPLDGLRVTHLMTTQVVRDRDYNLALDEQLPLGKDRRHIPNQPHHTHLVVLPIQPVPGKGPTFNPDVTRYRLDDGKTQPFMHVMFEEDWITEWKLDAGKTAPEESPSGASGQGENVSPQEVTLVGNKLKFKPDTFTVKKGRPVKVIFKNEGFISHSFDIPELDVHAESIQPGDSLTVTFTPEKSGEYEFICDVAEHKLAGMRGTMVVE